MVGGALVIATARQQHGVKNHPPPCRCVSDAGLPSGAARIFLVRRRQEGGGHRPDAGQLFRRRRAGVFIAAAAAGSSSAAAFGSASSGQESLSLHVADLAARHQQRVRTVVEMSLVLLPGLAPGGFLALFSFHPHSNRQTRSRHVYYE